MVPKQGAVIFPITVKLFRPPSCWIHEMLTLFFILAFTSYSGFWLAYLPFLFPSSGIAEAYANHPGQLPNTTGVLFASWTILTTIFL